MKDIIKKEYVFNHPIDRVWNAISKEEEISTWFINADFKPEVGYEYTFFSNGEDEDCTDIQGVVKESNPYKLSYTWVVKGTSAVTTVTWLLEEVDSGTKLYLEHSGISNYEGETAVKMFESFNGGWDNCLHGLSDYINKEVHAG